MTRVGWLCDDPGYIGGAELTEAELRAAAPEGVEIVPCPAGGVMPFDLDAVVVHNCVSYQLHDLPRFNAPAWKYHHDVGPHLLPTTWEWLRDARPICVSPLQREWMGLEAELIPPLVNLEPFRKAALSASERHGAVAVGPWMGPNKAPDAAAEWAAGNGGIDFYGGGPLAPPGSVQVSHEAMPMILARYKTYVHLPRDLEPCGRSTIEAWAAGCEVVVNGLEGARHWIANEPERLDSAGSDFWELVLN